MREEKATRRAFIEEFLQANQQAGVDAKIIDLCAAYARQRLKKPNTPVGFYHPEPTLEQLEISDAISPSQKESLRQFCSQHHERGVDERVTRLCVAYAGNLMLQNATVIFDEEHLADKLGYPLGTLRFLSSKDYKCSKGYFSLQIPKRNGGVREIDAPRKRLKSIQRWILDNILAGIHLSDVAHGFRIKHSISTNAEPHVGKEIVIKLDLKDFFPTITFQRVLGIYLDIGYVYNVASILTRLTTYQRELPQESPPGPAILPQGAPTSPALSNLVCRGLDARLSGIADHLGYTYTRYADDMTFSTSATHMRPGELIREVHNIIKDEGFESARQKLCVQRKGTRQVVTGLVVNQKVSVPRKDRRRLRAIIHNCKTKGLESQNRDDCPYFLERLKGQVAFVMGVNAQQGERLHLALDELIESEPVNP